MNGQTMRKVRALLAHRQPALAYLVAIAIFGLATDLLVARAAHQLPSFSRFSRREFDNDVLWRGVATLRHGSLATWAAVAFAVVGTALLVGWLRGCYLVALAEGRYSLRIPRRMAVRLVAYWFVLELYFLGLTALADAGQPGVTVILQLLSTPIWLYSEYAIVYDEIGPLDGVRRSLRMFRVRPRESVLAVLVLFIVSALALIAFENGFTDSTHVQPTYLFAWELVGALILFVSDVVLSTLYRDTRLSAGGPAGS